MIIALIVSGVIPIWAIIIIAITIKPTIKWLIRSIKFSCNKIIQSFIESRYEKQLEQNRSSYKQITEKKENKKSPSMRQRKEYFKSLEPQKQNLYRFRKIIRDNDPKFQTQSSLTDFESRLRLQNSRWYNERYYEKRNFDEKSPCAYALKLYDKYSNSKYNLQKNQLEDFLVLFSRNVNSYNANNQIRLLKYLESTSFSNGSCRLREFVQRSDISIPMLQFANKFGITLTHPMKTMHELIKNPDYFDIMCNILNGQVLEIPEGFDKIFLRHEQTPIQNLIGDNITTNTKTRLAISEPTSFASPSLF